MHKIDVLIVTALKEEYDAVRNVGVAPKQHSNGVETWLDRDIDSAIPYLIGEYKVSSRVKITVALARPTRMGSIPTGAVASTLVERLKPYCLAMCGVCAGNPADLALGDVIISETVYSYDEGKRRREGFEGDHRQIPMSDAWVRAAQELAPNDLPSFGPPSKNEPRTWVLERLLYGDDPRIHPAHSRYYKPKSWVRTIRRLETEGFVYRSGLKLTLTEKGRAFAEEELFHGKPPLRLPFQIKVGPIASGNAVVKDGLTWDHLKMWGVRTVLGLEMEAATIGNIAHRLKVPEWIVVKGVMDHADPRKDDRYKPFAARASAEVLCKFLADRFSSSGVQQELRLRREQDNQEAFRSVWRLPVVSPHLFGREKDLGALDKAWVDNSCGVVSVIAFGGVGKTSLISNWYRRRKPTDAVRVYGWSFYSQGTTEDRQASGEPFLDHALRHWYGVTDVPQSSWARGERLAACIRKDRTLLLLDGVEPLQSPRGEDYGRLKEDGLAVLLRELAEDNPGLCICTSRVPLTDLEGHLGRGALSIDLEDLPPDAGGAYLQALGVQGLPDELEAASAEFGNHALALTLLGTYLDKRCRGDVRRIDTIPSGTFFTGTRQAAHARRIMKHYADNFRGQPQAQVLLLLGLFDQPADVNAISSLRRDPPIPDLTDRLVWTSISEWAEALAELKELRLVQYEDDDGPLDCHPLVREYFGEVLRSGFPVAWTEANRRLFEHYATTGPDLPGTIDEMAPLYTAVTHACQAKAYVEAWNTYWKRIQRGHPVYFNTNSLGAFQSGLAALGGFYSVRWREISPAVPAELDRADYCRLLQDVGFHLKVMGRYTEAAPVIQEAIKEFEALPDLVGAAVNAENLSENWLLSGDLPTALARAQMGRNGSSYADLSGEPFRRMQTLALLGDILMRMGRLSEAEVALSDAEAIRYEHCPERQPVRALYYLDILGDVGNFNRLFKIADRFLPLLDERQAVPFTGMFYLFKGRAHALRTVTRRADEGERAKQLLEDSIRLIDASNLPHLQPRPRIYRGIFLTNVEEMKQAKFDFDKALMISERFRLRLYEADCHMGLCDLHLKLGEVDVAAKHLDAARPILDAGYRRFRGWFENLDNVIQGGRKADEYHHTQGSIAGASDSEA